MSLLLRLRGGAAARVGRVTWIELEVPAVAAVDAAADGSLLTATAAALPGSATGSATAPGAVVTAAAVAAGGAASGSSPVRVARVTWVELEVPAAAAVARVARVTWVELEVPAAASVSAEAVGAVVEVAAVAVGGQATGDVIALRPAGEPRRRRRVVLWGRTYKLGPDGIYRELEAEVRRRVRRALQIAPGEAIGRSEVAEVVEQAAAPVRREIARRAPDLLPLLQAIVDEIEREEDEDLSFLLMVA
jgi:hypothetical protein